MPLQRLLNLVHALFLDEMSSSTVSQKKIKVRRAIISEDDPNEKSQLHVPLGEISASENSLGEFEKFVQQ